jgi:carbonic anhydrase
MADVDQLLEANRQFAATYYQSYLQAPPTRRLAVLTCMDARIDPQQLLGLQIGEAHVIRNAGGRASDDAIRSLIISSLLLGTKEYLVIHHTDCGMLSHTNEEIREKVAQATGADASDIDFQVFTNLEKSVRDDVERIKHSPYIPDNIDVSGFIYDVRSGRLSPVST